MLFLGLMKGKFKTVKPLLPFVFINFGFHALLRYCMQLKNKSPFKKIALFFSAFFCILLLIFAFLPWFVSTHTGKEMLLTFVNKRAPGTLKIDSLSLSWIGSQKIEGLHFDATDGKISAFCSEITCESSLFTTLSPSHHTGL